MRALSVRSALHLNSQPISRVVTMGVAGVQLPNVLFSILTKTQKLGRIDRG